jgi:hypothetical protein
MPIQNGMRSHGQQRRANERVRVIKANVGKSGYRMVRS